MLETPLRACELLPYLEILVRKISSVFTATLFVRSVFNTYVMQKSRDELARPLVADTGTASSMEGSYEYTE